MLAFAGASHAETGWLKAETPRFTIYSMGSERGLRAYAERVEVMDAVFWEVYGLQRPAPPPRKLSIYLVDKPATLRLVAPSLREGVVGFYSAGPGDVFAMGLAGTDNDYILLHEYVHHLMLQHFPYGYPAWLVEGYAEYFMSTSVEDSTIKVGYAPSGRTEELNSQAWLPWEDVLTKRVSAYSQQPRQSVLRPVLAADPLSAQRPRAIQAIAGLSGRDRPGQAVGRGLRGGDRSKDRHPGSPAEHLRRRPDALCAVQEEPVPNGSRLRSRRCPQALPTCCSKTCTFRTGVDASPARPR
ncbi:hypothetical protein ACRAWD_25505 [Caulobacter segnis]